MYNNLDSVIDIRREVRSVQLNKEACGITLNRPIEINGKLLTTSRQHRNSVTLVSCPASLLYSELYPRSASLLYTSLAQSVGSFTNIVKNLGLEKKF